MPNFPCFIKGDNINGPTVIFDSVKYWQEMIVFPPLDPVLVPIGNSLISLEPDNI